MKVFKPTHLKHPGVRMDDPQQDIHICSDCKVEAYERQLCMHTYTNTQEFIKLNFSLNQCTAQHPVKVLNQEVFLEMVSDSYMHLLFPSKTYV